MKYFSLYIFIVYCSIANSCENFTIHYCTDIPFILSPISDIKCLQLLPINAQTSFDYTVENYIIKNTSKCYDIVSLDSLTSDILYSEQCQQICSENYCQLFDKHPSTSIINIFYSTTLNYESIMSLNNSMSSYDYYRFDSCSSLSSSTRTTLIIVYVLVGIVIVLAIAVLVHCLLRRKYKRVFAEQIYQRFWLLDFLCCDLKRSNESMNRINPKLSESVITDNTNMTQTRLPWLSSPSAFVIGNGTSNSSSNHRRDYNQSSNETLQYPSRSTTVDSADPDDSNARDSDRSDVGIENDNQERALPLLEKISSRASEILSARQSHIQYTTLGPTSSIIVTRH